MENTKLLDVKMNFVRENLISDIDSLIKTLQHVSRKLKDDKDYYPNSLGVIQGRALEIDLNCAKLYTYKDSEFLVDYIEKL